ncbi:MAG: hypothetical protein GX937_07650 [Lentisphaerae bacterium]|nr:hypothetical protein [Lentisphaerota bacterium]
MKKNGSNNLKPVVRFFQSIGLIFLNFGDFFGFWVVGQASVVPLQGTLPGCAHPQAEAWG